MKLYLKGTWEKSTNDTLEFSIGKLYFARISKYGSKTLLFAGFKVYVFDDSKEVEIGLRDCAISFINKLQDDLDSQAELDIAFDRMPDIWSPEQEDKQS